MENNKLIKKRMESLKKRTEMLKEMSLDSAVKTENKKLKPRKKRSPVRVDESSRRKSRRILGLKPEISLEASNVVFDNFLISGNEENTKITIKSNAAYDSIDLSKFTLPIRVDGSFRGWVNPEVCARYQIPLQKEMKDELQSDAVTIETVESTVDNDISNDRLPASKSRKRVSSNSAKEHSKRCLHSNPNCYFYRNVVPNTVQWMGDWTEEEIQSFCSIAEKYGCGDRWGLFASYIPHRVGYQCSNFYRQYMLPKGIIKDPDYIISSNGEAIRRHKK